MTESSIRLPRRLVNEILHLGQLAPEQTITALLGARDGVPRSCHPVPNTATPDHCYALAPQARDAAVQAITAQGETVFAVLISHPAAPAEPSAAELDSRDLPGALRLIISLDTKGVLELRGFRLDKHRTAQEIPLLLTE